MSYRYRGRVARSHIQKKIKNWPEIKGPEVARLAIKYLKKIIIPYSAMKIMANNPALYSVLNPDTNSDSPSAKSKGVRLVSAIALTVSKVTNGALTKL